MPPKTPPPLPEEFLAAEFEYIANSAFQANEDRSKAASFFLVAVGSLAATIIGAIQIEDLTKITETVYFLLAVLFFVLTVLGALTIAQLARLRLAWHYAALAMNQMKDFYIKQDERLKNAFRWQTATTPKKFKVESISFYIALEVSILSALTASASAYFAQKGFNYTCWIWEIAIVTGGLIGYMLIVWYWKMLTKEDTK